MTKWEKGETRQQDRERGKEDNNKSFAKSSSQSYHGRTSSDSQRQLLRTYCTFLRQTRVHTANTCGMNLLRTSLSANEVSVFVSGRTDKLFPRVKVHYSLKLLCTFTFGESLSVLPETKTDTSFGFSSHKNIQIACTYRFLDFQDTVFPKKGGHSITTLTRRGGQVLCLT